MVSTTSSSHDRRDEVGSKEGWVCVYMSGGSVFEPADGSQNMKQCRGNVWWVRCTELQAREQACWGNYNLMGSFGRQLPGVNVVWRDEVRLKWNFWLENVFKWKGSRQTSCTLMRWEDDGGSWNAGVYCHTDRRVALHEHHTGAALTSSTKTVHTCWTTVVMQNTGCCTYIHYLLCNFLRWPHPAEGHKGKGRCFRDTYRGTSEDEDKKDHYALLC